jgi:hypothetical protein
MNPQVSSYFSHFLRPIALATALTPIFLSLSSEQMASSQDPHPTTQDPQGRIEPVPTGQEKQIHVGVRSDIPLKFEVNNLNSKTWAYDLEIDVTNTSEKPMYFFGFYLELSDIKSFTGGRCGYWLHYGRGEFLDFTTPIKKDDVPLLPGEKHTLKLSEANAKDWDYMMEKEGRPEPKLLEIHFHSINFGDGTGYDLSGPKDTRKKQ